MVRFQEKAGDKDHAIKQTAMNYVGSDEEEANAKKKSVCDKMGLFYSAPVTKFWLTTVSCPHNFRTKTIPSRT